MVHFENQRPWLSSTRRCDKYPLVNKDTWAEDLASVEPGTVVIWNSDAKMAMDREDVISYPVPMTKMAKRVKTREVGYKHRLCRSSC